MKKRDRRIATTVFALLLAVGCLLFWGLKRALPLFTLIFTVTDGVWETPIAFGAFHLACLVICLLGVLGMGMYGMHHGRDAVDRTVFYAGILLLVLEIYKQYFSYFFLHEEVYDFSIFPFQFCSLPLYLYLAVPWLSEGRLKEAFYSFLSFFGTVGGCLVMGYPAFTDRISLCIHTMLWHSVMIAVGIFLIFARGYGQSWRHEILPASVVFLASLAVATVLNVILTPHTATSPKPLNLFYMNPYESTYFLLIRDVWHHLGWLPAMVTYILLFLFMGATGVFFAVRSCKKIIGFFQKK